MAGAGLYSSMPVSCALNAPSDRVNIGVIGLGFGVTNMRYMLEGNKFVHCTALCDVDQVILETQAAYLKERFPVTAGNMKLYTDFRKLLEDKDIDGVIVSTPEHWHTYIFAEACKAGKAIYVEKPTGHTVSECIRNNNVKTNSPVDKGCYATLLAHIANISHRLGGTSLEYLPGEQKFRNNPEADSYIYPKYHNNWKYPQV